MLSLEQVAEHFGVSEHVVRQWCKSGELRYTNTSISTTSRKPRLKVSQKQLEAFELARSSQPITEPIKRPRTIPKGNRIQRYKEA